MADLAKEGLDTQEGLGHLLYVLEVVLTWAFFETGKARIAKGDAALAHDATFFLAMSPLVVRPIATLWGTGLHLCHFPDWDAAE